MRQAMFFVLVVFAFTLRGQTTSLTGRVVDDQGAPLPGMTVTISSPVISGERATVSGADGEFRFVDLPPGRYEVRASQEGMSTQTTAIDVALGQASSLVLRFRASPPPSEAPFTIVPVFYGTNRTRIASGRFGSDYDGRLTSMTFGIASVSVPRKDDLEEWELADSEETSRQDRYVVILTVTPIPTPSAFRTRLRDEVAGSRNQEVFVFVHGYNTSFEEAIQRTALLAYDLEFRGVPVAFTWPSRATYRGYLADEEAAQASIEHLETFIQLVANESGATRVHLIAHSMGSRVMLEALRSLQRRNQQPANIANLIMAAPDLNVVRFGQLIPNIVRIPERTTLYASSRDRALQASHRVHDSPRAGEGGNRIAIVQGMDSIDVTSVDTSLTGHAYYGDNRSVMTDLHALITARTPPGSRNCLLAGQRSLSWTFRPCGRTEAR